MKKLFQKIINKNIIKILNIYASSLTRKGTKFEKIFDEYVWYQTMDLIKIIKRNYDKDKK